MLLVLILSVVRAAVVIVAAVVGLVRVRVLTAATAVIIREGLVG